MEGGGEHVVTESAVDARGSWDHPVWFLSVLMFHGQS